jgi:flagellar biogenesis protein FliO
MPLVFWGSYLVKLAVVALVLGALYALGRKFRDSTYFARRGRAVRVLESSMLSPHAALHIVRVGTRYFLIGHAAGAVTHLAELTAAEVSEVS